MDPLRLPCGGTAYYDMESGSAHRCRCGAVVGSVGMPSKCKEAFEKYDVILPALGSKIGWDYYRGREHEIE